MARLTIVDRLVFAAIGAAVGAVLGMVLAWVLGVFGRTPLEPHHWIAGCAVISAVAGFILGSDVGSLLGTTIGALLEPEDENGSADILGWIVGAALIGLLVWWWLR